jgi:hypothetical protein
MDTTAQIFENDVLGFFELDDGGVIRYYRPASAPTGEDHIAIGQNFFDYAYMQNREELRRRFRRFIDSREAADSFNFDCMFNDAVVHTKVTFTRAFKTDLFPPEGIVMLSIREGVQ